MEGGNISNVLLQNERIPCSSHEVLDSLWMTDSPPPPPPPPPAFHGLTVNFRDDRRENAREEEFYTQLEQGERNENYYDNFLHQPEKKRRLTAEQVHFLERSFEVENKLEPERKIQLAKELALQPRQVAIWFQNRRARYKTKQLEKDYEGLKSCYDKLKADYDTIFKENESLRNEVHLLTEKLLLREEGEAKSEPLNSSINELKVTKGQKDISVGGSPEVADMAVASVKQEDASSSVRSDAFDSESPHCVDANNSILVPDDSSHVLEPDFSDISQEDDDDDILSKSFLQPPLFPKLEDECYNGLSCNAGNFGFPNIEDQSTWFWTY